MRRTFPAVMTLGLGLGAVLAVLVALLGCNGIPGPQPPEKKCPASCPVGTACTDPARGCQPIAPPGPVCTNDVDQCGCFVMPPETGRWEEVSCPQGQVCTAERKCVAGTPPPATCPTCPAGYSCADPAVGCVKDPVVPPPDTTGCNPTLDPAMLPPVDNERDWKLITPVPASTRTKAVNDATLAAQRACTSAWRTVGLGGCLTAGKAGIDAGFALIAHQLHLAGIKAGQPVNEGGQRIDALSVAGVPVNWWEEHHLFAYTNANGGCLTGSPYKNTYVYTGAGGPPPPVDPPPAQGACSSPQPPKVGKFGGPKPHNRTNDSTPQFYNREATRWDGSVVTGYCDLTGWNGARLWCPARMECKPPEEAGPQNFKCAERGPCEELGVSGSYGGKPLWRSDGTVNLSDNAFQATCSGCTWLEVCAADGTACSRCQIDAATGLCAAS